MKAYINLNHNPYLTRVIAVFLIIPLLLQILWQVAVAESAGFINSLSPSVYVYFGGTKIYDGMEIDPTCYIHASYKFTADLSELAGSEDTVILPRRLNAAYAMTEPIIGTDSKGNEINVGALVIDEKLNVKVSFFDLQPQNPGDTASSGNTASPSETASPGGTESVYDEVIAVEFAIPVIIDTTGLTANEDGSYNVELESGGKIVTVKVVPAAPLMVPFAAPQVYAYAGKLKDAVDITKVELSIEGQVLSANTNTTAYEFKSGDIVFLKYSFSISDVQALDIMKDLTKTYSVDIPIPMPKSAQSITNDLHISVVDRDSGAVMGPYTFGSLTVKPATNEAYVTFKGDFWSSPYATLGIDSFITIDYALDKNEFSGSGPYKITLSDGTVIYLDVDKPTTPPSVQKKTLGKYDEDTGIIAWEVEYDPGDMLALPCDIKFIDTFDSSVHTYVNNSFEVNGAAKTVTPYATAGTTTVLEYDYTVQDRNPVTFTYQTKLASGEYLNTTNDTTARNDVTITHPPGKITQPYETINDFDEVLIAAAKKKMLAKSGKKTGDREIEWTITVNTHGINIDNGTLVVTDALPAGLKLDTSSVKVFNSSNAQLTSGTGYTLNAGTTGSDFNGGDFNVTILSSPYDHTYTIIYKTTVVNKNFDEAISDTEFSNTAKLGFKVGNTPYTPTSVTFGPIGINTDIIQKSGALTTTTAPDYVITWTVTVNPHHVNVTSATITDTIPNGLEYVDGSLTLTETIDVSGNVTTNNTVITPTATSGTTLVFDAAPVGTNTKIFTFKTRVTEAALSQNGTYSQTGTTSGSGANLISSNGQNSSTSTDYSYLHFVNSVRFDGAINGSALTNKTASGYVNVRSRVVIKQSTQASGNTTPNYGYNYYTKTIPWRIYVNENKIIMNNAVLTDELETYLKYVDNSLKVLENNSSGSPLIEGTDYFVEYPSQINSNTITLTFANYFSTAGKTAYVTFNTVVDLNKYTGIKTVTTSSIPLRNEASLTWDGVTTPLAGRTTVATQNVPVKMIQKGGVQDTNIIHYSVNINPHDINLQSCYLTDTIPDTLKLDTGSVKLYNAKISPYSTGSSTQPNDDGALIKTNSTVGLSTDTTNAANVGTNTWNWTYDANNKLTVYLPNSTDCYILEYDCYIVKAATKIENTIEFSGSSYETRASKIPVVVVNADGMAVTSFVNRSISLNISKIDSRHPEIPLPGIDFSLWTMIGNTKTKVGSGTTKADGSLIFSVLSPSKMYWLVEDGGTQQIESYYVTDKGEVVANGVTQNMEVTGDEGDTYSFTTGTSANGAQTSIIVKNAPETTNNFVFYKKCKLMGKILPGAQFRLVTAEAPITQQNPYIVTPFAYTALSDINGMVSFPDIPKGTTYILKEIKAPEGHTIEDPNKEYIVEVAIDGSYTIAELDGTIELYNSKTSTGSWTLYNNHEPEPPQPVTVDVEFTKVNKNDTGILLNGATFTLTEIDDAKPYTAESTSVSNGVVVFEKVPVGIYTLKEIDAPPFYDLEGGPYTLIINASGKYRILDSNGRQLYYNDDKITYPDGWKVKNIYNPVPKDDNTKVDIKFRKINSASEPLNGAKFTLTEDVDGYPAGANKNARTFAPAYSMTVGGEQGLITFKNVPVGVYLLEETVAPEGYVKDGVVHTIVVNYDGSYSVDGGFKVFSPAGQTDHNSKWNGWFEVENEFDSHLNPPLIPPPNPPLNPPPNPPSSTSGRQAFSRTRTGTTVTPNSVPNKPNPHTHDSEHTLVTYDGGKTYIELDENGTPVGEWRWQKNEDGNLVWTYEEYSSESDVVEFGNNNTNNNNNFSNSQRYPPDTGDYGMIFFWILSFYTAAAVLIALAWTKRKNKRW